MNGGHNKWVSPGVVFGVVGMVGAIIAAWISMAVQVARVEIAYDDVYRRLGQIEDKLDDLITERRKESE